MIRGHPWCRAKLRRALSTKDLVDARDQYHWHLIHKKNVVGTAIGLYYIRQDDDWPSEAHLGSEDMRRLPRRRSQGKRTFENSEIRDYSWPVRHRVG